MHAKACAGTENVEWSGQILMGLSPTLSRYSEHSSCLQGRMWGVRMGVGWLPKVERLSD